ncbi:PilZ domain-containing protein [bacterium]|nr:PilZ domain-containing protein [bacterium]
MRELIEKDREITVVPTDYKCANKGIITDVQPQFFTVKLKNEAKGFLKHNYCEFFTTTSHGTLSFNSYPESIEGNTIVVATPAKHKFLQRRQYRRIKFIEKIEIRSGSDICKVMTLDISAGGMKCMTSDSVSIDKDYDLILPLSESQNIECRFSPVRIEKDSQGGYLVSGRFLYKENRDRMVLIQYCTKRSIEIKNK